MIRLLLSIMVLVGGVAVRAAEADGGWAPIIWNGERSLVSSSLGWKAVVSLARGRLVYFGPADREINLLFATTSRDDPAGWGGHRLWLGPQSTWAKIWPPPVAWEASGPESHTIERGKLRMVMPDAGDGWPRLTRTYHWDGSKLVCGAELTGGTKPAQVIQIIQVPRTTVAEAQAVLDSTSPAGYVLLPAGEVRRITRTFSQPTHVKHDGAALQLRHLGVTLKLGFRPQTLAGRTDSSTLRVGRGTQTGRATAMPDLGFCTQVFLGGNEPFIELEQLSPLFAAGADASFAVVLEGAAP